MFFTIEVAELQWNALFDFIDLGITHQFIQEAAGLAGIARHFGTTGFIIIQLFQHHHGQEDVVFLKAKKGRGVVNQDIGVEDEQSLVGDLFCIHIGVFIAYFLFSILTASRTSSTWPSTFTLRHSWHKIPLSSNRKVLRSMPRTFLPYMFFILITSNKLQSASSLSDNSSNLKPCLALKFSCDFRPSRDTPRMMVFCLLNFAWASRKSCPSRVQPGVLSLG